MDQGADRPTGAAMDGDPVIQQFRAALREVYGDRVERALLYGSRARGDAREDSDYDFAVFLTGITSRWEEMKRLSAIATEILGATGQVIHARPLPPERYDERTFYMREVRQDGRHL